MIIVYNKDKLNNGTQITNEIANKMPTVET